ncbi:MAG: ATP-binding protein [Deltaproteobacteria bacterium]|nr:ATP-binding protein [Deltaproteobacteria bacterium]
MKFYGRQEELKELKKLYRQAKDSARMTVLTGRRRVGKTLLSLEFTRNHKFIYLFVSKKSEQLLCVEYIEEIKRIFNVPVIGEIRTFKDIFALLLEISRKEHFTLIIDEFQEFYNINPSVYSEMQHLWDVNKNRSKLNLILIGSVYSLMYKIFQNSKEPLFGRADRFLFIKPFAIKNINVILGDYGVSDLKTVFDYYVFTGGIPRYIDSLTANSAFSYKKIVDFALRTNSPFINEGKNLLIEEFGKEYGTYFSILELISVGKTARSEIESILERNTGGYLERLEKDYDIISKHKPINAKPNSRLQKYRINDNFLNFWFRFIYRNHSTIETCNFDYIKDLLERDYATYCGRILERFFHELFADTGRYNRIGSYWERGNQNEIDLVAINDMRKVIVISEVKLNKSKIDIETLKLKSRRLLSVYRAYKPEWLGLSLDDARKYIR